MKEWIDCTTFARLAEISDRAVRKAVAPLLSGDAVHWRGYPIVARMINSRGGASGKSYLVKVSSLPPYLQDRLKALQTPVEGRSTPMTGNAAARERSWWIDVLSPAMEHPKGSAERKAAYVEIAAKPLVDWNGRRIPKQSVRTLQRRMERMEGEGSVGPLARYGRADKGKKRTFISRVWDAAVPFDDATKAKVEGDLKQEIRGLIVAGMKGKNLRFFAEKFLLKCTSAYGFRPNDMPGLVQVCKVPKHLCDAEAVYKKVHRHKTDRKASVDAGPYITRSAKGLRPMEIVVADVHHCNVLVGKENGKHGTAKAISFLDVATRRCWNDIIFFEGRGGVRNIDVIETFRGMAAHPAFGLPELIYFDNGTEYNFAEFLDDALQLAVPIVGSHGRQSRIIRALPYNAKAKPIEAWFGHFEQQYLSLCQGYRGDDIVNPKRPELGKLPAPFPGGFDAFRKRFFGLLKGYEHMPQGGVLDGKSPSEAFDEHVRAGWSAAIIDPLYLNSVFARQVTRKLVGGRFDLDGREGGWSCPELDRHLEDTIVVRVPIYHGYNEVDVFALDGRRLGVASPQEVFTFGDQRGAQHSARRKKAHNAAIRELGQSVPKIDAAARIVAHGEDQMPTLPNSPRAVVTIDANSRPANVVVPQGKPTDARKGRQAEADEVFAIQQALAGRRAG